LAGLAPIEATELDRVVRVGGTERRRWALMQGLALGLGAFDRDAMVSAFAGLGLTVEPQGTGTLPDQLQIARPQRVRPLLGPERQVRVRMELELDPPLFAQLRELAFREPSLTDALSESLLAMTVEVGWVFTRDHTVAAPSLLRLALGETALAPETAARRAVEGLLSKLGHRGAVHRPGEPDVSALLAASRSADPAARERYNRTLAALQAPPFSMPAPELVAPDDGPAWLAFGPDLVPLDQLGVGAEDNVALVQDALLGPTEILIADRPGVLAGQPDAVRDWLGGLSQGQGPLEQVWLLGGDGDVDLAPPAPVAPTRRRTLTLER
jgi:hypothetical protein